MCSAFSLQVSALYIPWLRCERMDKMHFATRDVTFVGEAAVDISKPVAFN